MNQGITTEELAALRASKNEGEWNAACDAVKKARNGNYPADWFVKVMMSGLSAEVAEAWGRPDAFDLKVEVLDIESLDPK